LSPASYLADWLISLFLDHLELNACAHIWDVLLLEGDSFLFRASLGLLAVLEPRLFFPDRRELLELLKSVFLSRSPPSLLTNLRGENKAALEVAKREKISLDGPKYDIYGVDEKILWEKIDSMDEWWKDSTWTRLLLRELPDL
jgi:TBC1 domain family member 14